MERDFLGLKWNESSQTLKQITNNNTFSDSVSGMQWRWWDKNDCCCSQFQPHKVTQVEMGDTLTYKLSSLPKELKFPFQFETTGTSSNDQFPEGIPFVEWFSTSPTHHPRNKSMQSESANRLTIIYDDKVYVFEDISPDKAEAIIRLAKDEYFCLTTEDMKRVLQQTTMDLPLSKPPEPPSIIFNSLVESSLPTFPATTLPKARKATLEHFMKKRKNRNKSMQSESPNRLTIIYDDKVYVFEDISIDKAEAIMRSAEDEYFCLTTEDMKRVLQQTTMELP
ncbi:protein TIFY 10A-like [Durio zibethinus]|uniref:Protein TIFY n=1 Tax=Durio zibethinus TaxID=66656 RepID=A0A6P6A5S1_DURZI|nr:protein TIFY 10A-like [Durio zibethinus]